MGILESIFLPPSTDHLELIKYLILLVYFIHFPFISLMLGGTFFSLFFKILSRTEAHPHYARLADDLANTLIFRKTAGIILGVLPLIVLTIIEGQVFYDANLLIVRFMLYTTVLVSLGITLAYFYQESLKFARESVGLQLLIGAIALGFLMFGYLIFSSATALILDPGRWPLVKSLSGLLFSWNVVARGLHFLAASFAVSGIALVFFFFNWKDTARPADSEYTDYVRKFGGGVAIAFTLLQPVLVFWNLITLPTVAYSTSVFLLTALVLFLIMIIALLLYKLLKQGNLRVGSSVSVLFILAFLLIIVTDHIARENATENHTQVLVARSNELESELEAEHERLMAASITVDLDLGKQIFTNQCTSCHQFEQKVVGPAYNDVLPKYVGKEETLIDFIRNPKKVNPDLPAMPKLGLGEKELKSVAAYILKHFEENRTN